MFFKFLEKSLIKHKRISVLPGSGVNLKKYEILDCKAEEKALRFLMIARLVYDKGVVEYVEAAKKGNVYAAQTIKVFK